MVGIVHGQSIGIKGASIHGYSLSAAIGGIDIAGVLALERYKGIPNNLDIR